MPGKMSKGKAMPAKGGKPKPKKKMKPAKGLSKAMFIVKTLIKR